MTLSRFLRDYVYIPLGGSRKSNFRTYNNLLATFVLGGLWHGAGWTFIFWGFLHGIALSIHRLWTSLGYKLPNIIAWIITFNFVNIAWIFFRAKEWDDAIKVLSGMIGLNGIIFSDKMLYRIKSIRPFLEEHSENFGKLIFGSTPISYIIIGTFVVLYYDNVVQLSKKVKFDYKLLTILTVLVIYTLFSMSKVSEFLYFNF